MYRSDCTFRFSKLAILPSRQEQRLHFLKQQERRQQQSVSENEKLQKLKERVEAQENKLKKIRAMRGQVDYSKIMNGNLCMCRGPGCPRSLGAGLGRQAASRSLSPKLMPELALGKHWSSALPSAAAGMRGEMRGSSKTPSVVF